MTDHCPTCNAAEVPAADTPRTVYACGASSYDGRPGTFTACPKGGPTKTKELADTAVDEARMALRSGPTSRTLDAVSALATHALALEAELAAVKRGAVMSGDVRLVCEIEASALEEAAELWDRDAADTENLPAFDRAHAVVTARRLRSRAADVRAGR